MHVVLYQPEIPQNTGNIARTCAATGARLHLIRPLGFSITDRHLKRAGLDYWHLVNVHYHNSYDDFISKYPEAVVFYLTTKGSKFYHRIKYPENCFLMFGPETRGLPDEILNKNRECCVRVPMREEARSLNLSNTVAIVLYEAIRQNGFPDLI